MSQQLSNAIASSPPNKEFEERVKKETVQLRQLIQQNALCNTEAMQIGLELESWCINDALKPIPLAPLLVESTNNQQLSEEIAKFIFEINLDPITVGENFLTQFNNNLSQINVLCNNFAKANNARTLSIGIPPNVDPTIFKKSVFSSNPRYKLLNDSLLQLRNNKPWSIHIEGNGHVFKMKTKDICLEALNTSAQIHIKVPFKHLVNTYNYCQILAAPMVALAANAPMILGNQLWHDTRVPLVKQTVSENTNINAWQDNEDRVLFGKDYLSDNIIDLYDANLKYKPLLPIINENSDDAFYHLKLHNSTIWRWNRPILDCDEQGKYHIRIEHRVQSSPTSSLDMSAQLGFFVGLVRNWQENNLEARQFLSFDKAKHNFFQAAKYGLDAEIHWTNNKKIKLIDLIKNELLAQAKEGLKQCYVVDADIQYFIDEVLGQRLAHKPSGSIWQIDKLNELKNVDQMLNEYIANQQQQIPLYQWT